MTRGIGLALLAAAVLVSASVIGSAQRSAAQDGLIKLAEAQKGKPAPRAVAPKGVAPRAIAPKAVAPRSFGAPKGVAPKTFTGPTVAPKTFTGPKTVAPKTFTGPKGVAPKAVTGPTLAPKAVAPRQVAIPKGVAPRPVSGAGFRAIGPRRTGRIVISGRNYTVWRGAHRVRYGGRWATLGAIGALGLIAYGGANYYPYAYVSAVGDYCEGLTEDGCVLQWQEVPTIEGPTVLQCVAYCPWQ